MDETMSEDGAGRTEQSQTMVYDPPAWVTTNQLENELWNAIMEDSSNSCDEGGVFEEIEDSIDDDDGYEDEAEQRRSTLRMLSDMRPQLAELLGGPPAGRK